MTKTNNHSWGLLNAQYRSVLKKCLLLNVFAGTLFAAFPAAADNAIANASGSGEGSDLTGAINYIKNDMGNEIGANKTIGHLYVDTSFTNSLYSSTNSGATSKLGAWLWNYQDVYIGYKYDSGKKELPQRITISNRHNTNGNLDITGGGVIQNGDEESSTIVVLNVHNVDFSNNTVSSSTTTNGNATAVGGVIHNYGTSTENFVSGSTFSQNYVMSANEAFGGAIANASLSRADGTMDVGYLKSENNSYTGNYAGNKTTDSNTLLSQFNGVTAKYAEGGAIYNSGALVSEGDIFDGNSAFGEAAFGGAIYNENVAGLVDNLKITNTDKATANFINNYVSGTSARGGAIYNLGNIDSRDSFFSGNKIENSVKATGGAVYNDGRYISHGEIYENNSVTAEETAVGGAISNMAEFAMEDEIVFENNMVISNAEEAFSPTSVEGSYEEFGYARGGAVYNEGSMSNRESERDTISFTSNKAQGVAAKGGAVYNALTGRITFNNADFTENTAYEDSDAQSYRGHTVFVSGGAISNNGQIVISNATFSGNTAESDKHTSYGGAIDNTSDDASFVSQIVDSSFFDNTAVSHSGSGAVGGAIHSQSWRGTNPTIARMEIIARNKDVVFDGNKAVAGTGVSFGGALANDNHSQMNVYTDGQNIIFNNNVADYGGAVSNAASGANIENSVTSQTSYLRIAAENGNIIFQNNKADEEGGALFTYSDENGTIIYAEGGHSVLVQNNSAKLGGGISNSGHPNINEDSGETGEDKGYILAQLGDKGDISFVENKADQGGAVYNMGELSFQTTSGTLTSEINFSKNSAEQGGAIYNGNILKAKLTDGNSTMLFDNNKAGGGLGGAIYNAEHSNIDIQLANSSKIVFNTVSDDVYNLGSIKITGDSPAPVVIALSGIRPTVVNNSATQIILNSTWGGTGKYEVAGTQLNMGSTGYIGYDPVLTLSNNVINLSSGASLSLDTADTLTNNDFDLAAASVVNYKASEEKPNVNLANTFDNAGLLNLSDGVISDVTINTLKSADGTIRINIDNPNLKSDRIVINNIISGTTNIDIEDGQDISLGIDDKIYFAQTSADQSLEDYKFVTTAGSSLYEIGIGHDHGYDNLETREDWYLYRSEYYNPEILAFVDLPRAAMEQSRSLLFNVGRISKGTCDCYQDGCNYRICNFKDLGGMNRVWATPVYRSGTFDKPVETDVTMYGVDFGFDHQFSISSQFGIFGSYRDGSYENSGKGEGDLKSHYGSKLDITSILGGAYYRQYFGDLFMSGAVYGGQQSVDVKADNGVTASVDGLNIGVQAELGYDIRSSKRSVLTPSIKATYDYIKFDDAKDSTGKEVSYDAMHDIELEAGIKYEYQFNNEHQLPTTGYIKPSVIQTIANGSSVKINNTSFDDTVENETLGRIEVGADAEIIENFSLGAFGNYTFGSSYSAWGVGGNIRYVW